MINELTNWDILEKVVAIGTDGSVNTKLAVRNTNVPRVPYTAHKLNLIVQRALLLSNSPVSEQNLSDAEALKKYFFLNVATLLHTLNEVKKETDC